MFNQRGQSIIEYAIFLVVFIAAMIVMAAYIKRGIQGNWHANISTISTDLYEPNSTVDNTPLFILFGAHLQSSNYSLSIEEGSIKYTPKAATWVKDGNNWQIWSR